MNTYLPIIGSTILAFLTYILGRYLENHKRIFDKKLDIYSHIVVEINNVNYARYANQSEGRDNLVKLFAPARLIAGKQVIIEIREYYSLVVEYYEAQDSDKNIIMDRITKSAMELEQLMRRDLGVGRHLTTMDLFVHTRK